MSTIAGHTFADTPSGLRCSCGKSRSDVLAARRSDIGQVGFAHTGALNEAEYQQIECERERVWAAVCQVSSPA